MQEMKRVSEDLESTQSQSKRRRPNIDVPRHLVLEANEGNAESSLETTESQEQNDSHRLQAGIMNLPPEVLLSIFSNLSIKNLCVSVAPVCRRWAILSKDPRLWKDLTLNSNAVSTKRVCGFLQRSPKLRRLTLCYRRDTDTILEHLLMENRPVERIEIRSCTGSRQNTEVQGDTLAKIVEKFPKLHYLAISETVVTGSSFYRAIGKHHDRFKSLIMDRELVNIYLDDFLEGYYLSKHSRADKTT
jgi:hypothetical protein